MFDVNDESLPEWERDMLAKQGFNGVDLPKLSRKRGAASEYYVYSDKDEFKSIEADTAVIAIEKSELEQPYKVVPAHKRIDDIVQNEDLEYVENNPASATSDEAAAEDVPEAAPEGEEEKPAA